MKHALLIFLLLAIESTAQITEHVIDMAPSEALQGVTILENGNLFVGGYGGDAVEEWTAISFEWNEMQGALPETKVGDLGPSQWQAVTQIGSTNLAGGGLVNNNLGPFTQFNAVTFRPNGNPWVSYETTAFMGANNMVLDVQPIGETHFVAAGYVTFDFSGEEFVAPTAMIPRVSGTGPQNYQLESWDGPRHGLGVFLKTVVEEDQIIHFLFEEWDEDKFIVGYKIMSYELQSGDLLSFFDVLGFQKIHDFALAPDGRSWYVAGHKSDFAGNRATVAQLEWDGEYIGEATLSQRLGVCKGIDVDPKGVYSVGDAQTDELSQVPFAWQLSLDLEPVCYSEYSQQDGSFNTVHDMALAEDDIYFVGKKVIGGREESAIWATGYCDANNVQNVDKTPCQAQIAGNCISLDCELPREGVRLDLHDMSGKLIWSDETGASSWCVPEYCKGLLAFRIQNRKGGLVAAGKLRMTD